MTVVYVGLGANLETPAAQIHAAATLLGEHDEIELRALSSLYRSAPLGPAGQAEYCNAVAELETSLSARNVLEALLDTERRMGRERGERWGPRLIDLDLLLHGDAVVDEPGLTVPHPEMTKRNFVLQPLAEIAPFLDIPGQGQVATLAAAIGSEGLAAWEADA